LRYTGRKRRKGGFKLIPFVALIVAQASNLASFALHVRNSIEVKAMKNNKRNYKRKNNAFVLDQDYIDSAVEEFLNNGGQITRIEFVEKSEAEIYADKYCGADEFLMGN